MSFQKTSFLRVDWMLIAPVFILGTLSLTTLFSLNSVLFRSQLVYFIASFIVFLFFSQVHYKILQLYAYPIYIVSIFLLCVVLLLGIESRGAVRWLDILGIRIQFSEIIKPFVAITFCSFLSNRPLSLKTLLTVLILLLPILLLIYLQPDLGNALIYLIAITFSLIVSGFSMVWFFGGFLLFVIFMPIAWQLMRDYQKQRILTFIYPTGDPLGTSYNAIQSVIAVGSGGIFGKGFQEGTQSMLRFLPERHTDFIFATISEGLGFIGACFIILAFGFLLYRIYTIAVVSNDRFCTLFAIFTFFFIITQFFVNIGMNIGIVPIVGITLPFVSYGGSSLLSNFILLGLLSAMSIHSQKRTILEIR